jgi:uncharacterized protein YbcI
MSYPIELRQQLTHPLQEKLQALYQTQLGHQPSKITCQLFDKTLAIVIKDPVTQLEKLLLAHGQQDLAQRVRASLEKLLRLQLKSMIEQVVHVDIVDLMVDTHLHTNHTSIIAVFADAPQLATLNGSSPKQVEPFPSPNAAFNGDDDE